MENNIFYGKLNFTNNLVSLKKDLPFIKDIEIREIFLPPLRTGEKGETFEVETSKGNAYGVYIRYSEKGINDFNISPSRWLADFSHYADAYYFAELIKIFVAL